MSRKIKAWQLYKHFKGGKYTVIGIAHHSETNESMVVYSSTEGSLKIYCRPYDSFISKVDKEKYPDATQEYRFELIEK